MCAINGVLSHDGSSVPEPVLWAMARVAAHRGPDGEGVHVEPGLGLGHRRLAILDLSEAGHQPMLDASGRYVMTYNGEIYNFKELRTTLAGLGVQFRSQSDSEVLLAAFATWGADCLPRLNGMFAFAIWDRQTRTLFCARDRFGIKPFHYYTSPQHFIFGSEIKQVLAHPAVHARVDRGRLATYLAFGVTDDGPRTFFDGIRTLTGGHYLIVRPGAQPEVTRWWTLPSPEPGGPRTLSAQQVDAVRETLQDAVRLRLRSDVAVGSCLSGGVDSNAVLTLMAELLADVPGARLDSFTAIFDDARLDESKFHAVTRAKTGAAWKSILCKGDRVREALPAVLSAHDEPFPGTGAIAQYLVNQLARDAGVTVLLNGQGSDEIFCGYHTFFGSHLADMALKGRVGALAKELRAMRASHERPMQFYVSAMLNAIAAPYAGGLRARKQRSNAPSWVAPGLLDALPEASVLADEGNGRVWLAHRRALEERSMPAYLRNEDRSSMAASIESRLPFLDHRLVSMAVCLPSEAKLKDGWTKRVLRDALRGRVPDIVLDRRDKMGFPTPNVAWMRDELSGVVREAMEPAQLKRLGAVDVKEVQQLYRRWTDGDDRPANPLWRITCASLWMRQHGMVG
jgi:asparagine synthase (glutamine-hydrolysing)